MRVSSNARLTPSFLSESTSDVASSRYAVLVLGSRFSEANECRPRQIEERRQDQCRHRERKDLSPAFHPEFKNASVEENTVKSESAKCRVEIWIRLLSL